MRVHSTVGLVTNSSSETYTMPRSVALPLVEAAMRELHPNVQTWSFTRVDWDGSNMDECIIARAVYDLGFSEHYGDDTVLVFQDSDITAEDPDTWTPEFKRIVNAVAPVLTPLLPLVASRATDVPGDTLGLRGRLLVVADGQLHLELSDEATRIAGEILHQNGRYDYR
jgi:hypothetical protein